MPKKSSFDKGRVVVVLVSTRNPLNIGAAARAMSNFGFSQLRLVSPYSPSFREARSAVGASALLASAREYATVAEAVADCARVIGTTAGRNRELEQSLRSLPDAFPNIRSAAASGKIALLFGSEKRGLSNHDLSYCQWLLRIPTIEDAPSMNLGQAVAVCLYELARTRQQTRPSLSPPRAESGELDRLTDLLLDALEASEYLKKPRAKFEGSIRQFVRGLDLSGDDSHTLTGMLRQVLWKLRRSR